MEPPNKSRARSTRARDFEIVPLGEDEFEFTASLVDRSFDGSYEPGVDSVLMHHFVATGKVAGPTLELVELDIDANRHPFAICPLVIPSARNLVGLSLTEGWRRAVLDRFGGERGCTHVTTLLLTLNELTTLIYFQRMNHQATYGPQALKSGEWMATGLEVVPDLLNACHALTELSPVVRKASRLETNDQDS